MAWNGIWLIVGSESDMSALEYENTNIEGKLNGTNTTPIHPEEKRFAIFVFERKTKKRSVMNALIMLW